MDKRFLGYDPVNDVTTFHYYDPTNDQTTIESVQDVSAFLDASKALHNTSYQKDGIKEEWMHGAHFPAIIQEKWLREYGINVLDKNHMPRVLRMLNDPEWKYLKLGSCKL
jgi:hypothetical protein